MKNDFSNLKQVLSKSGYTPKVQVTTGTYCVTTYSTQSTGKIVPSFPLKTSKSTGGK